MRMKFSLNLVSKLLTTIDSVLYQPERSIPSMQCKVQSYPTRANTIHMRNRFIMDFSCLVAEFILVFSSHLNLLSFIYLMFSIWMGGIVKTMEYIFQRHYCFFLPNAQWKKEISGVLDHWWCVSFPLPYI